MAKTRGRPTKGKKAQQADDSADEDPNFLGAAGEVQAEQETGCKLPAAAKEVARYLEILRKVNWNKEEGEQGLTTTKKVTAVVLQRRGDEQTPSCDRCRKSGAAFATCVAAPVYKGAALVRGSCANCIWEQKDKQCSLRGKNMAMDEESIGQFVGDGESLRAAMKAEGEQAGNNTTTTTTTNNISTITIKGHKTQNIPSSTFFGAFAPDMAFARVGLSQKGPRSLFDGQELRFPISRDLWEDPRNLLTARSDLAHFVAIVDARLYELGSGDNDDYLFWQSEAKRIPELYDFPGPANAPVIATDPASTYTAQPAAGSTAVASSTTAAPARQPDADTFKVMKNNRQQSGDTFQVITRGHPVKSQVAGVQQRASTPLRQSTGAADQDPAVREMLRGQAENERLQRQLDREDERAALQRRMAAASARKNSNVSAASAAPASSAGQGVPAVKAPAPAPAASTTATGAKTAASTAAPTAKTAAPSAAASTVNGGDAAKKVAAPAPANGSASDAATPSKSKDESSTKKSSAEAEKEREKTSAKRARTETGEETGPAAKRTRSKDAKDDEAEKTKESESPKAKDASKEKNADEAKESKKSEEVGKPKA